MTGVRILFAIALLASMSGCVYGLSVPDVVGGALISGGPRATDVLAPAYRSTGEELGDQSMPTSFPQAGAIRLFAYPLNAAPRQG